MTKLEELAVKAMSSSDVCSTWRDKIKGAAPELFVVVMKPGKWYKITRANRSNEAPAYICFQGIGLNSFGWNHATVREWTTIYNADGAGLGSNNVEEVNDSMVEALLSDEFYKRGLTEGSYVKELFQGNQGTIGRDKKKISNTKISFHAGTNYAFINNLMLFRNGEFSELDDRNIYTTIEAQDKFNIVIRD
jgi:hypothetical protein